MRKDNLGILPFTFFSVAAAMDLTPKSYKDPTQYFAAFCPHPSSNPLIYPTSPQSSELTDVVLARSPVIPGQAGLGVINCGLPSPSVQSIPMGGNSPQTLLTPAQCWAQGPTSSACFSDTSPSLSNYTGQNLYDNVYDFDFKPRSTPAPVSRPGMASQVISSTANKWSFQGDNLSYEQPVTSVPSNYNHHSNDLPDMNRANFDGGGMLTTQRASNPMPTYKEPPRKRQKRSSAATGKYQCDICGMNFTRNSNCKSHMKIHDPNRKYPHKCMYPNCTKKFSRKTDLVRHIDSVHKRLKNFVCEDCGHGFARQDTLRRHCEDGCRRQQRLSHRPGTMIRVSLQDVQPYQPPPQLQAPAFYHETAPTFRTLSNATSQTQLC